jgi:hypothetical protein
MQGDGLDPSGDFALAKGRAPNIRFFMVSSHDANEDLETLWADLILLYHVARDYEEHGGAKLKEVQERIRLVSAYASPGPRPEEVAPTGQFQVTAPPCLPLTKGGKIKHKIDNLSVLR